MNKKVYIEPVMKPVLLKQRSHFMAGSLLNQKYSLSSTFDGTADEGDDITIDTKGDSFGKWDWGR